VFKGIELNCTRYNKDSKCPCCSSEVDKGGRLELKKIKNFFLKCSVCKYVIRTKKVVEKQEKWLERRAKSKTNQATDQATDGWTYPQTVKTAR